MAGNGDKDEGTTRDSPGTPPDTGGKWERFVKNCKDNKEVVGLIAAVLGLVLTGLAFKDKLLGKANVSQFTWHTCKFDSLKFDILNRGTEPDSVAKMAISVDYGTATAPVAEEELKTLLVDEQRTIPAKSVNLGLQDFVVQWDTSPVPFHVINADEKLPEDYKTCSFQVKAEFLNSKPLTSPPCICGTE